MAGPGDRGVRRCDRLSDGNENLVGVGTNPSGAAVTPDGAHAYVTNLADSTVSVINTADNTVTSIGGFDGPWAVAIGLVPVVSTTP